MHKESLVVVSTKPRAATRTARSKTEEEAHSLSNSVHLHARLPSADSGIQADGGFDSLSRYRGGELLSTLTSGRLSSDPDPPLVPNTDRVGTDSASISSYSSSDLSHGSLPRSKRINPPDSKFPVAVKPVPPLKPTLSSSPSKSGYPRPTARFAHAAPSCNPPLPPETSNGRTIPKVKPMSSTTSDTPPARSSDDPRHPTTSAKPANLNQNVPSSKPVAAQRKDPGGSVAHLQPRHLASSSDPLDNGTPPKAKVVPTISDVEVSFTKTTTCLSSHSSSSDHPTSLKSPTQTVTILDVDSSGNSDSVSEPSCKRSTGTALNLQVLKPSTLGRNQPDKATNQGQGCIALTRPLKLGAPSKLSVRTVHATTLSSQPAHLVPSLKSTQNHENKQQHAHQTSSVKPKPKIAPRPSVLTKTSSPPRQVVSSSSSVTTFSESSSPTTNNIHTHTSQLSPDTCHKPEVPVVHRVKTVSSQPGRTEIPVTHVVHTSASHKNQTFARPSSFLGRHTPDRDRHAGQRADHLARQPIYENIRFEVKDGFDLDDADARIKHADLILKRSDELLSDAIRMLVASPPPFLSHRDNKSTASTNNVTDDSAHRDGDEGKSHREHVVPIFDARTGKLHSAAARRSYWSEWAATQAGHSNGDGIDGVTWSQRKERIDSALTWLRQELADLRDMDTRLISQFQRCQDTIESLKNQRESWEGLSEEGEEGDYWEDYELNEYNRRYLDSPGGSSCNQFSPGSRQPSLQDMTLISLSQGQIGLHQDRKTANGQHGVTQDIEITL